LTDAEKKSIQDVLEKLKQANSGSDVEAIKSSMENLNKAWEPVAQKMYQAAQQEAESKDKEKSKSGDVGEKSTKEEVEDADFEVVEESS
jgi:molecular chaperone DnaK